MQKRLLILFALALVMLFVVLQSTMLVNASASTYPFEQESPFAAACLEITSKECNALEQIYIQSNGTQWDNEEGWLQNPRPCEWYGVTCATDENGNMRVESLNLSWNSLQGSIPPEIGDLTALRILNLSGNGLSNSLPREIGNLSRLEILNLSENQLAGELPASLSQLTNLKLMHLFENKFVGDLPLSLTELQNLRNFKFQNTHLCIPNDRELESWLDQIYYLSRSTAGDCQSVNQTARPLVLIYAVLDNDLSSEWSRLVNNAEAGARSGAFDVKLLVDAKGSNNSYEYTLQENYDNNCPSLAIEDFDCNRYTWRKTLRVGLENSATRDALLNFVDNALLEYPNASHVILSLIGHGSGWGANALPAQPRGWRELSGPITDTMGGMLWDDTMNNGVTETVSLSTQALGSALREIKKHTGRTIDLLYLDACSMAMAEVAYEVRDTVKTLLASQNTKWATFPYDQLLPLVATLQDGKNLGTQWIQREVQILHTSPGHPFTYSLIDVSKMDTVLTATKQLAAALIPLMPTRHLQLRTAYSQTSHFDSNYNGKIDELDSYVDLYDFAAQIKVTFADQQSVVNAAQAVQSAVQDAVYETVYEDSASQGDPAYAKWSVLGGISIYLPVAVDEQKRAELYSAPNLNWAEQGNWDEFLTDYWVSVAAGEAPIAISQCAQTSLCPTLNGWGSLEYSSSYNYYFPFVSR